MPLILASNTASIISPDGSIYTSVSATASINSNYTPDNLFDQNPTVGAEVITSGSDAGFAYAGMADVSPLFVEFEVNTIYTIKSIYYAQRDFMEANSATFDKIGTIDIWVSDTTPFSASDPGTAPDRTISITHQTDDTYLEYALSAPINGRYVLLRLTANAGSGGGAYGGTEFRLGGAVASCVSAPPNMIAWWAGDGNADDIQDSNHGSLVGGTTFAAGEVDQGFSMDGLNDFVQIPDSASLSVMSAITIDAWINPDTITGSAAGRTIVSKYDTGESDQYSYLLFILSGGQVEFAVYNNAASGAVRYVVTPGTITPGVFTHVAATFDTATQAIKIYFNGVDTAAPLGGGSTTVDSIFDSDTPVRIGAYKEGAAVTGFFDGVIDEVEILDRALSAAEIASIYMAGSFGKCKCTPPPEDMVSWWPAEGNASDIQDDDGTLQNGTPQNGAAFAVGKVGQAFSFAGPNAVVEVPDDAVWDFSGTDFAIDTWVNFNSISGTDVFLGHDEGGGATNKWIFWLAGGGFLEFHRNSPDGSTSITSDVAFTPALGQWYHVAVTREGSTWKFYIDGVQNGSAQVSSDPNPNATATLTLGKAEAIPSLNGYLDEVEIFNRALSAAEITAIYNAGSAGKCRPCTPAPSPGMISWWPGDGNATDIQDGNDGTLLNGATFAPGKVGQAFSFDGSDDYVEAADSPNLNPLNAISVDAWIYLNSDSDHNIIVNKDNGNDKRDYLFQIIAGGQLSFVVFGSPGNGRAEITSGSLSTNTWYHVAGTYDQQTIRIYVNGAEVAAAAFTNDLNDSDQPLGIGQTNQLASSRFHGLIDEVELFSRALSQSEIQKIYDTGSGGKCKPPVPVERQFANISGRANVGTGQNVAIAGFIIQTGSSSSTRQTSGSITPTKTVLIRGIGPSLAAHGVSGFLADPVLSLHGSNGALLASNDDWQSDQQTEIEDTGLAPNDPKEAAILALLNSDTNYTAILRGASGGMGIGLVEVYDLQSTGSTHLANISARALVGTSSDVLIGGLIVQGGTPARVVLRAIGPSLAASGISNPLPDPMLALHDTNGALIETNDDWQSSPQATEILASGLDPGPKESAILFTPAPGNYTAIVRGVGPTPTGVGLVEAYNIGPPPP